MKEPSRQHWIARTLPLCLCVTLLGHSTSHAQTQSEFLIDALGCEVPISTRYHVYSKGDSLMMEIPGTYDRRIWITPLRPHEAKPLDSKYRGALKVEHYAPGCGAISAFPWVAVQGLHEEVDLIGLSEQEVAHVIDHCNATMNPEAVAISDRMVQGCAAVLRTHDAMDALLGQGARATTITPRDGTTRPFPVTSWTIRGPVDSPSLQAQGVHAGADVTSVCGVPVSEVEEGGASLCCSSAVTDHMDATIVEDGKPRTITVPVPAQLRAGHDVADLRSNPPATGCGP